MSSALCGASAMASTKLLPAEKSAGFSFPDNAAPHANAIQRVGPAFGTVSMF